MDGEVQADVALCPDIAKHKLASSVIKGDADILIFPDLNIAVNLKGVFLCTQAVFQPMCDQGFGHIINVSSVSGKNGHAKGGAYCASKWGVVGFTEVTNTEGKPFGVKASVVCPGPVDTSRMDAVRDAQGGWEASAARVPLGRVASDDDIGHVITWLCSPDASLITGQAINVNGGMHMD